MDAPRPLILNTSDLDGGAAIATHRLLLALRAAGVTASMAVQARGGDTPGIFAPETLAQRASAWWRPRRDALRLRAYPSRPGGMFSANLIRNSTLPQTLRAVSPNLVHLSWINRGFVGLHDVARFGRPVVWTLHDMWPFTGGCHYDDGCGRFTADCGRCPLLASQRQSDLSRRIWQTKRQAWRNLALTIISPSRWLAAEAARSSLFARAKIHVAPNCIDTGLYQPLQKAAARQALGLPDDHRLILIAAEKVTSDARKGFDLLQRALYGITGNGRANRTSLVVLGASGPQGTAEHGIPTHYLGRLRDDVSKALVYSAADVTVTPSRQENLSNTVMESLACGTPVAAFDIGGMPDLIDHERNGFLARAYEPEHLAAGIAWILADPNRHAQLSATARAMVQHRYAPAIVARQHIEIYRAALAGNG